MSLLRLYEDHGNVEVIQVELDHVAFRHLNEAAKRNGLTPAQMAEEIINSFLSADFGEAPHL